MLVVSCAQKNLLDQNTYLMAHIENKNFFFVCFRSENKKWGGWGAGDLDVCPFFIEVYSNQNYGIPGHNIVLLPLHWQVAGFWLGTNHGCQVMLLTTPQPDLTWRQDKTESSSRQGTRTTVKGCAGRLQAAWGKASIFINVTPFPNKFRVSLRTSESDTFQKNCRCSEHRNLRPAHSDSWALAGYGTILASTPYNWLAFLKVGSGLSGDPSLPARY